MRSRSFNLLLLLQPTGSLAYRTQHSVDHGMASGLPHQTVEVVKETCSKSKYEPVRSSGNSKVNDNFAYGSKAQGRKRDDNVNL